jgi:hypothetical protein
MQIFRTLTLQCPNQIFWHPAQSEAANHDGRAVKHVADGLIRAGYNFVHSVSILSEFANPHALCPISVVADW